MTVIIAGAGLAGLSCAVSLVEAGVEVELHEASPHAGGRCRSWLDPVLGAEIDNGTHLLAGGNDAAWAYLRAIGSKDSLSPLPDRLPMLNLETGRRWQSGGTELLPTLLASWPRLGFCGEKTVAEALGHSRQYHSFWRPLTLAVLNSPPETAPACLLKAVAQRSLWKGRKACRLYQPRQSLSASYVEPALAFLRRAGMQIHLSHPLRQITREAGGGVELGFDDHQRRLSRHDRLVLALPPWAASKLLPSLPDLPTSPITNLHLKLAADQLDGLADGILGCIGGTEPWLFRRGNILSITTSAAERSVECLWIDIANSLKLQGPIPPHRLITERRATIRHDHATEALRPRPDCHDSLILAGDWTATGLPCCIEGAILSGRRAAQLAIRR